MAPTVTVEVAATGTQMASQTEAVTGVRPTVTVEVEATEEEEEEPTLVVQVAIRCRILGPI